MKDHWDSNYSNCAPVKLTFYEYETIPYTELTQNGKVSIQIKSGKLLAEDVLDADGVRELIGDLQRLLKHLEK